MHLVTRGYLALIGAAILSGGWANAQQLTEQEVLRRFSVESSQARALKAQVEVVRSEARARSLLPNSNLFVSREDVGGLQDQFVTAEQTLPLSGRLGLVRRAGNAAVKASQNETRLGLWGLRSELRLAFYDLLLAQQKEAAMRQGAADLQEIVRVLREREKAGESPGFDVLRAERELADTESDLVSVQVALAQARSRLASFLGPGTDPAALIAAGEFRPRGTLPPLAELLTRALAVRGDLTAREAQLERFEFERRAAERQRIPEPALAAGLKRFTSPGFSDNGYLVSVTVRIPVFNRGQADSARAKAQYQVADAERQVLQRRIEAEVRASYASFELLSRNAYDYTRELGTKGAELSRTAEAAYQEGEQGILQLLDAQRVALASQLRALELSSAAKRAEVNLDRAVGEEVLP